MYPIESLGLAAGTCFYPSLWINTGAQSTIHLDLAPVFIRKDKDRSLPLVSSDSIGYNDIIGYVQ